MTSIVGVQSLFFERMGEECVDICELPSVVFASEALFAMTIIGRCNMVAILTTNRT
ncbi:MAG: hypothetical protein FWE21_03365 [Defluviitaleaceae bacterium]|nr:hypothetical protein [Defluviitaleaceae bacterium]